MKPEAQRIAIAEACEKIPAGFSHHTLAGFVSLLPDYLNDLNAMHEAEKALTDEQWPEYRDALAAVIINEVAITGNNARRDTIWHMINATAAQRAEAFLRTLNLWTE